MEPMLTIALRAARAAGDLIQRASGRLDRVKVDAKGLPAVKIGNAKVFAIYGKGGIGKTGFRWTPRVATISSPRSIAPRNS